MTPALSGAMSVAMDKAALRDAIVAKLEAELDLLLAAAQASKDEATDPESKAEGKYDMRGQSAAYLATGQNKLAAELTEAIAAFRLMLLPEVPPGGAADVGALVVLDFKGARTNYFIGPARGGLELESGGAAVTVITAASPLGRQLLGRRSGEGIALGSARHLVVEIE